MGTTKKILYAAITLGILIFFFYIIYSGFKKGDNDVNRGLDQYASASEENADVEKSYYDGKEISGKEVIDAINKFKGSTNFTIAVTNGKGNTACYLNYSTVASDVVTFSTGTVMDLSGSQSSKGHANYINPDGSFKGKVYYDSNKIIVRIDFKQV